MNGLSDNDYRLIEAKIDGSLNDQEQKSFEQKLESSEDFDREFQMQNMVIDSLVQSNNEVLRKEFKSFLRESKQQHRLGITQKRNLMIAASLSFLMLCGIVYYLFLPISINHEEVYQAYFEVYPAPPITRGDEVGASLSDFDDYRKGRYLQALEDLKSVPKSEMTPVYLAMCYLETNQVSKAVERLEAARSSSHPIVSQTATWYLALAHLKNDDVNVALRLLQKITSEKQLYYKKAGEITEQLVK